MPFRLGNNTLIVIEEGRLNPHALSLAATTAAALSLQPALLAVASSEARIPAANALLAQAMEAFPAPAPPAQSVAGDYADVVKDQLRGEGTSLIMLGLGEDPRGSQFFDAMQALALVVRQSVLLLQSPHAKVQTVLICTAGQPASEKVVLLGLQLTKQLGAQAILMHVAPAPPSMYAGLPSMRLGLEQMLSHDTPIGQHLRDMAASAQVMGVKTELELRHGFVAEEILRACEMRRPDLVVVGAAPGGLSFDRIMLDEIAPQVMGSVPVPLLIVRQAWEGENGPD